MNCVRVKRVNLKTVQSEESVTLAGYKPVTVTKALTNILQQQEKYKANIISKVGEIAQELKKHKREHSETQLKDEFKKIWEDIKRRPPSVRRLQDSKQVKIDVERELLKFLHRGNEQLVIEAQNSERGGSTKLYLKIKK